MVFFCPGRPTPALETVLTCLDLTSIYVGLYLQTTGLQERLKALPESVDTPGVGASLSYDPDRIIGHGQRMRAIMQEIAQAAPSRSTVLLRGESGTGKELVARALHRLSDRGQQPFVKLNCAALPESLLESELFGHERGAFTGAVKTRRGRFELADHGTLFLDEIGDISLATQIKLLRVLQERTFERVGGSRSLTVDVRIIAATNADLEEAVRTRHFREDLYYRLHVVPIVLPPLRERKEDIPLLVGHFLQRFNAENHKALKISSPAMDLIVGYAWPGNVRELENCIERMVVMARREIIAPEDVPLPINIHMPTPPPRVLFPESTASTLPKAVADIERERLLEALRRSGGVQTRAATLLGITPRQLGYKLKKYHIAPKMVLG
jgi:Nif-specific regulatory protein